MKKVLKNSHILLIIIFLCLGLGIVFISWYFTQKESYIATKTCIDSDQKQKLLEICNNNLINTDPSNCIIMVDKLICPTQPQK
jgi:hypothetical protein